MLGSYFAPRFRLDKTAQAQHPRPFLGPTSTLIILRARMPCAAFNNRLTGPFEPFRLIGILAKFSVRASIGNAQCT